MSVVAWRELRTNTLALLQRVAAGEDVVITVDGRPVAVLGPISSRRTWLSREEFAQRLRGRQADPALAHDLTGLAPGTSDDPPLP